MATKFEATSIVAATEYKELKQLVVRLKVFAANSAVELNSDTNSVRILRALKSLSSFRDAFLAAKDVDGIVEWAKAAENKPGYDIVVAYTELVVILEAAMLEIKNTFPVDGSGFLLSETFDAQANLIPRIFTPGQTAAIRARFVDIDQDIV